jgi:hypothetical protein
VSLPTFVFALACLRVYVQVFVRAYVHVCEIVCVLVGLSTCARARVSCEQNQIVQRSFWFQTLDCMRVSVNRFAGKHLATNSHHDVYACTQGPHRGSVLP